MVPLYQQLTEQINLVGSASGLHRPSITRLSLLVLGILTAQSCVPARIAVALHRLGLPGDPQLESIARRLRRIMNDPQLVPEDCYSPVVVQVIDWTELRRSRRAVVLIVDESSHTDQVHLLRLSLAYRGGSLPLAWAVWRQNDPLPEGWYWERVAWVLAEAKRSIPAGLRVIVVADRAYDVPPFIDQVRGQGWHWVVRVKARAQTRVRDRRGQEHELAALVRQHLGVPGREWCWRGAVFKDAGWRRASLVGVWLTGEREPLVVISDLVADLVLLDVYDRRFWIEAGFRADKRAGWEWEDSQVTDVAHHARLLLGMAWASLLALCLGALEADAKLERLAARVRRYPDRPPPKCWEHARASLFTLGTQAVARRIQRVVQDALRWWLPKLSGASWTAEWQAAQQARYEQTVRP
jgi:hypothetical protein